ncbi:proton-conducting transporter membrane subunit [Orbaceae bacterium ac157xtp]
MNLLYFTILIPLLTFLSLIAFGRKIKIENILIIGISSIGLLCLIMTLVVIDYHANTVPDVSLIYTRFLWDWFKLGNVEIPITLYLDGLSLIFLILIVFFALISYLFAAFYLNSTNDIYTFYSYTSLLISSLFLLILADNLFVFLVAWQAMTISCYMLLGIYYQQIKTSTIVIRAVITMLISDIFLVLGICLLYSELGTLNIRDILSLANQNLAIDSEFIFWVTTLLFVGVMGRAGLFPFHISFSQTALASMPVATLLQSCTSVLAGSYLVLRLSSLFARSSDIFVFMSVIAGITIIFASCISLVQNDIKRLVTYLNMAQASYIFLAFVSQNWVLSINYIICYCVTSSLLLCSTAMLIKLSGGGRDINKLGGLFRQYPLLYLCFLMAAASLSALPWVMSTFYTKGDIIWNLMVGNKMVIGTVALLGILFATLSSLRLIFMVFHDRQKINITPTNTHKIEYIPLILLAILSTAIFIYMPLPIDGIIPTFEVQTKNRLALQLLLAAVTILGILIAYILFANPNSEIKEIVHTPIGKTLTGLCHNEWYFDYLIKLIIIRPCCYITNLVQKDPLSKWSNLVAWGIKKVNFQVVSLENGRLRWYMMSIVSGCIVIMLLLILV